MSIAYQADVFCDRCPSWFEYGEVKHDSTSGMSTGARSRAKKAGWRRLKNESGVTEDVCPTCQARQVAKMN
jgi:hypothetical protein